MSKLNIALISGGTSSERQISLSSGDQVLESIDTERYHILRYDPSADLAKLASDAPQIDFALIILHGPNGEDGTIQGMLELLDIPYQGSGVLGSALAMNKAASKNAYEQVGLPTPAFLLLKKPDLIDFDLIVQRIGLPLVVKPISGGSSIGMSIVKTKEALPCAFRHAFEYDGNILVEAFVRGTELTCGVLGNDQLEALPVVEIIPGEGHEFFDYTAKYERGASREICPAEIDDDISELVKVYAKKAHEALYCRGYSRTDMILSGRDIFVIETNTIPGMTPTSLLPLSAAAAGIGFGVLLDRLILLGLEDWIKKSAGECLRRDRILRAMPALQALCPPDRN